MTNSEPRFDDPSSPSSTKTVVRHLNLKRKLNQSSHQWRTLPSHRLAQASSLSTGRPLDIRQELTMNDTKTANSRPPRLYVTADDDEFDGTILQHLREEGFDVSYLPMGSNVKAYKDKLRHLADDLELGENYAVIGKPHLPGHYIPSTVKSIVRTPY